MKVVLDASAAVAGVLRFPSSPAILDALSEATVVLAPELLVAEVTSALWKYVIAKHLSVDEALDHLDAALHLVDRYQSGIATAAEVLREASARRHSVYDIAYAVLARREGAAILTIDKRLRTIATAMGVVVMP